MSATRECFVPREGSVYAFADFDTLEMRTFAQTALDIPQIGFSDIAEALKAGLDTHVELAAECLGIDGQDAFARYKQEDPEILNARQYAKIGNYGMLGGMGPSAFIDYAKGYGIILTFERASTIHTAFRRRWRETPPYFRYCSSLCDTPSGKAPRITHPRSGLTRGDVSYTETCNHHFQHLAAMGAKAALYQVQKECWVREFPIRDDKSGHTEWKVSDLYGCRPWYFGHDEIGMEIPYLSPIRRHLAAKRLERVMIEEMSKWVPDVPIGATVVMCPRWYKGAKPVFVDGLLVPCKPAKNAQDKTVWVPTWRRLQ